MSYAILKHDFTYKSFPNANKNKKKTQLFDKSLIRYFYNPVHFFPHFHLLSLKNIDI